MSQKQSLAARLRLMAPLIHWQEGLSTPSYDRQLHAGQHWYVVAELNANKGPCSSAYRHYSTTKRKKARSPEIEPERHNFVSRRESRTLVENSAPKIPIANPSIRLPPLKQLSTVVPRDFVRRYTDAMPKSNTTAATPVQSHSSSNNGIAIKRKLQFRSRRFRTEPNNGIKLPTAWQERHEPGMSELLEFS